MMFTHNFDHPLYSTRWALSDWFQFLFENTVLSGGFATVLINSTYCLEYPGYIKKVKKLWILLYTMNKLSTPCIIP